MVTIKRDVPGYSGGVHAGPSTTLPFRTCAAEIQPYGNEQNEPQRGITDGGERGGYHQLANGKRLSTVPMSGQEDGYTQLDMFAEQARLRREEHPRAFRLPSMLNRNGGRPPSPMLKLERIEQLSGGCGFGLGAGAGSVHRLDEGRLGTGIGSGMRSDCHVGSGISLRSQNQLKDMIQQQYENEVRGVRGAVGGSVHGSDHSMAFPDASIRYGMSPAEIQERNARIGVCRQAQVVEQESFKDSYERGVYSTASYDACHGLGSTLSNFYDPRRTGPPEEQKKVLDVDQAAHLASQQPKCETFDGVDVYSFRTLPTMGHMRFDGTTPSRSSASVPYFPARLKLPELPIMSSINSNTDSTPQAAPAPKQALSDYQINLASLECSDRQRLLRRGIPLNIDGPEATEPSLQGPVFAPRKYQRQLPQVGEMAKLTRGHAAPSDGQSIQNIDTTPHTYKRAHDGYEGHEGKWDWPQKNSSTQSNPCQPHNGMAWQASEPVGKSRAQQDYELQLSLLGQENKKRLMMARQECDQSNLPRQDYQVQLALLEQQNKKRLMLARQEYEPASKSLALQDYELQLSLLEEQNKKRLMMSRQECEQLNLPRQDYQVQLALLEQQNKKRLMLARQEYEPASKSLALQDYELQLSLLEEQIKKRLMMARQECENFTKVAKGKAASSTQTVVDEEEFKLTPEEKAHILQRRKQQSEEAASIKSSKNPGKLALEDYEWQLKVLEQRNKAQDKIGDERDLQAQVKKEKNVTEGEFGSIDD